MKITKRQLVQIINRETQSILSEGESERRSEMKEFSDSRSGKKVESAGKKILSAAGIIYEVSADQTGAIRRALENISEFVGKVGSSLSGMGTLEEGDSVTSGLPTVQELRQLHKEIQRLEK